MHAASPAEWLQMLSLAVGIHGAYSAVWFLLVDADLADFDPRRLLATPAGERAVVAVFNAKADARAAAQRAALSAAALLMLLTSNAPESVR